MKKLIFRIYFYCAVAVILPGCVTNSFLPQTHNVPLFTEKNQIRISPSNSFRTADLGLAYSPTNHLGVMINLQGTPRYHMEEIAVGGFKQFSPKMIGEIYLGFGAGSLDTKYTVGTGFFGTYGYYDIDIFALKYFIQPNFGIKFNEKMDLSLSTKCTYWNYPYYYYFRQDEDYQNNGGYWQVAIDSINGKNKSSITVEPAITFRVGGEHTKFMLQTGLAGPIDNGAYNPYRYNSYMIRVGVAVNFGIFSKRKDDSSDSK